MRCIQLISMAVPDRKTIANNMNVCDYRFIISEMWRNQWKVYQIIIHELLRLLSLTRRQMNAGNFPAIRNQFLVFGGSQKKAFAEVSGVKSFQL